jgi:type VI secretion system Hcp family effector
VGIYMTINGIPGEATNPKFPDAIEVRSWSFDMGPQGNAAVRGDRSNIQAVNIVKDVDKSSGMLFQYGVSGMVISQVLLEAVRTVNGSENPYLTIRLIDVMISNYNLGGRHGKDDPLEAFTLTFKSYQTVHGAVTSATPTVQPAHQHLINRLKIMRGTLRQPGVR